MARTFLSETEVREMAIGVAIRTELSFEDYVDEEGWAEWMNEFTDAEDGEECTEAELECIRNEQRKVWEKAKGLVIIACYCNPYHARGYYNGEPVIRRDMVTPVEWVIDACDSIDEAKDRLFALCLEPCNDRWRLICNDNVSDEIILLSEIMRCAPEEVDMAWYKGEGIYSYDNNAIVMLKGDAYFEDDVCRFFIRTKNIKQ